MGAEANWRATRAESSDAAKRAQTHGGYGFAREFGVERKWREARLPPSRRFENSCSRTSRSSAGLRGPMSWR